MAYNNILDDQKINEKKLPKGNPYKLLGWMVVSVVVFVFTIFAIEFLIRGTFNIGERSHTLSQIHEGLTLVPLSFMLNAGIFAAYCMLFSQTFEQHFKGQILKAITLLVLIFLLLFAGGTIWMLTMEGGDYIEVVSRIDFWMNWSIFIIGHSLPVAVACYYAWEKRLQLFLIVVFICLVIFQSFMLEYVYPRLN